MSLYNSIEVHDKLVKKCKFAYKYYYIVSIFSFIIVLILFYLDFTKRWNNYTYLIWLLAFYNNWTAGDKKYKRYKRIKFK